MRKWNELDISERVPFLKRAVKQGITDLQKIEETYNSFEEGGPVEDDKYYNLHPELRGRLRTAPPKQTPLSDEEVNRKNNKARREIEMVQSSLNEEAKVFKDLGKGYKKAIEDEKQDRKDKWYPYKLGLDAVVTAAELGSSAYMLGKGAKAMNWLPNNRIINGIYQSDTGQIVANTMGTVADAYQLFTADNTRDKIENSIELPADVAGIVGGANWTRNTPLFSRYGNKIDNALDFMGYAAAGYDALFKPVNWLLDNINKEE